MTMPCPMSSNANLYSLLKSRFPDLSTDAFELVSGQRLTYGALEAKVARFAGALKHCNIGAADRVTVQVEKSLENVALYLACLQVGAIYNPLNTAYTAAELAYFIGDAEPKLVVCAPEKRRELEAIVATTGTARLETLDADGAGSLADMASVATPLDEIANVGPDDLAALLYTSGTTGRAKGAMITHGNLSSNIAALHQAWHFVPGDVLLHALPIYHVHGLFVALGTALYNGSKILWLQKFDIKAVLEMLPRATVMMGVPTFYTRLLEAPEFGAETVRHMRLFVSGSAPLLAETHRQFYERTGHAILERYGMTETGMITSNPYDGDRIAGTVGFPLPGISLRAAKQDGSPCAPGEPGVIEVKGPNVFKGYWRMPEKTAEEFRADGYFITGDIGVIAPDGRVSIVGRAKDLIITGGFNVYPKEIEVEIDALDGVVESAVVGVPHPDFGEGVIAVVAAEPGKISERDVIASLEPKLAKFKLPKRVFFVDDLPRNAMGKVQKADLRAQYANSFSKT